MKEEQITTRFSAVDWLANELPTIDWSDPHYREVLSKAKAMEQGALKDATQKDSYHFRAGEPVLVRNDDGEEWSPALFIYQGSWCGTPYYLAALDGSPYHKTFYQIKKQ